VSASASRILAALPQTQCTRCGYPDCAAYALAITGADAPINQCPPGGAAGIRRLARITGRPELPLNPGNGVESPRSVMYIDEDWCIGCTLCIRACPVDAILGANKLMHTVIEAVCTGCELCIPVCPVDCILVENLTADATGWDAWSPQLADQARDRYAASRQRLQKSPVRTRETRGAGKTSVGSAGASDGRPTEPLAAPPAPSKQSIIAAAQARARARRPG
jgi:electron transport complex protein RnfB